VQEGTIDETSTGSAFQVKTSTAASPILLVSPHPSAPLPYEPIIIDSPEVSGKNTHAHLPLTILPSIVGVHCKSI